MDLVGNGAGGVPDAISQFGHIVFLNIPQYIFLFPPVGNLTQEDERTTQDALQVFTHISAFNCIGHKV